MFAGVADVVAAGIVGEEEERRRREKRGGRDKNLFLLCDKKAVGTR